MPADKPGRSLSQKLRDLGRLRAKSPEDKEQQQQQARQSRFQIVHTPDRSTPTRPTPTEEECREEIRKWHEAADRERGWNLPGEAVDKTGRAGKEGSSEPPGRRAGGEWTGLGSFRERYNLVDNSPDDHQTATGGCHEKGAVYDMEPALTKGPEPEPRGRMRQTEPQEQHRERNTGTSTSPGTLDSDNRDDLSLPASFSSGGYPPATDWDAAAAGREMYYTRGFCPACQQPLSRIEKFCCGRCKADLGSLASWAVSSADVTKKGSGTDSNLGPGVGGNTQRGRQVQGREQAWGQSQQQVLAQRQPQLQDQLQPQQMRQGQDNVNMGRLRIAKPQPSPKPLPASIRYHTPPASPPPLRDRSFLPMADNSPSAGYTPSNTPPDAHPIPFFRAQIPAQEQKQTQEKGRRNNPRFAHFPVSPVRSFPPEGRRTGERLHAVQRQQQEVVPPLRRAFSADRQRHEERRAVPVPVSRFRTWQDGRHQHEHEYDEQDGKDEQGSSSFAVSKSESDDADLFMNIYGEYTD